jgi:hypothetical protein
MALSGGSFKPGVKGGPGRSETERVPAGPFRMWINQQYENLVRSGADGPRIELAGRLGIAEKTLKRYCDGVNDAGDPVEDYERERVEEMLNRVEVHFRELYPDHDPDIVLEPDVYCTRCEESTTPLNGVCLWCNGTVFLKEWDLHRPVAAPLPLKGDVALDRARYLREKYMLSYPVLAVVMGAYHGVWRKDETWRRKLRNVGVAGDTRPQNMVTPDQRRNRGLVNDGPA